MVTVRLRLAALVMVVVGALAVGARPAHAHQSSVTYSRATVEGAAVDYRILIDPLDAAVLIGDDLDVAAMTAEQRAALATSVLRAITVSDAATPCPAGPATVDRDGPRVVVTWRATCPGPIGTLAIDYDLLFFDDPGHVAALEVRVPGKRPASTLLDVDHARFVWPLADAAPSRVLAFVRAGMHHVATGLDHVCFVLTLLLAVVLVRDPDGRTWRLRPLGQALRATAVVASAFTLAHSLTLVAAALGWVAVPTVVVETAIALSIVWTAIEDVIRPDVRWRFALTFGFGLMHGLGFARMLAVLLPPADRIVPLLAFNVGVELAHLCVITIALPIAWLVARRVGADRYRRVALPIAAAVLAALGTVWLVERLAGVTLLGL